jgi:hypothetical protein
MTELRKRVARAICVERCAAAGDPPCHTLDGYDGTDCDDGAGASCGHLADAALAAIATGRPGPMASEGVPTPDERIADLTAKLVAEAGWRSHWREQAERAVRERDDVRKSLLANITFSEQVAKALDLDLADTWLAVKVTPEGPEVAKRSWADAIAEGRTALAARPDEPRPDLDLLRRDAEARQRGENLGGSARRETAAILDGGD